MYSADKTPLREQNHQIADPACLAHLENQPAKNKGSLNGKHHVGVMLAENLVSCPAGNSELLERQKMEMQLYML